MSERTFDLEDIGLGYTLATGKLYCDFALFQEFAEQLLACPVMTHEFADPELWRALRVAFEEKVTAEFVS